MILIPQLFYIKIYKKKEKERKKKYKSKIQKYVNTFYI